MKKVLPFSNRPSAAVAVMTAALCAAMLQAGIAGAQEMTNLSLKGVPPDMIQDGAPQSAPMVPSGGVDLGQAPSSTCEPLATQSDASVPATPVQAAVRAVRPGTLRRVTRTGPPGSIERAVFSREPVRVMLSVGAERLVTLPAPAALHVPSDIESVARLEVIDRTLYATALVPFAAIRIVAELVDSGQQIPLDLVATAGATASLGELEISAIESGSSGPAIGPSAAGTISTPSAAVEEPAADMVQLTRHAARQLYAPRRLAVGTPGVHQVTVRTTPVPGLMRGASVEMVPLGQWKSGSLYVTAVRVTNRSRFPLELPLENVRGKWLAATAQHGRIGPAGSEIDTTTIYLVCEREFEACL